MFSAVKRSFQLLSPREKLSYSVLVASRVAVQVLDVMGLLLIGVILANAGTQISESPVKFVGIEIPPLTPRGFFWATIIVAIFFVIKSLTALVLLRLTARFLSKIEALYSMKLARYLFSGGLERLNRFSAGDQIFITGQASQLAFANMLFSGATLMSEAALFLIIFATFLAVDWQTGLLVAAYLFLVFVVFQFFIGSRVRDLGERLAKNLVRVNDSIVDLGSVFREITVFEKLRSFLSRYESARGQQSRDRGTYKFVMGIPRYLAESALIVGVALLAGLNLVNGNQVGGLAVTGVFLAGGVRLVGSLLPIQNSITDIRTNTKQARAAQDLLSNLDLEIGSSYADSMAETSDSSTPLRLPSNSLVCFDHVTFSFSKEKAPTIVDLSLQIESGEFVALIGPSGSGKSTLANLLMGLYRPSTGEVRINGFDHETLRRAYPGFIGYVPQSPALVSGTIASNVALETSPLDIDESRVVWALQQADLGDFIRSLKDGIHTEVGRQKEALSGGQLQRLGIARSLYPDPSLLVFDEATSALDAESESRVVETMLRQRGTKTLVAIAHRISTIKNADRVIYMENGRIGAQGTLGELRRNNPTVKNYVKLLELDKLT